MHPGLEQTTYVNHTSVSCSLILIRAFWELEWSKALVDEVAAEPSPAPSDFYFMGELWTENWLTDWESKGQKVSIRAHLPISLWMLGSSDPKQMGAYHALNKVSAFYTKDTALCFPTSPPASSHMR